VREARLEPRERHRSDRQLPRAHDPLDVRRLAARSPVVGRAVREARGASVSMGQASAPRIYPASCTGRVAPHPSASLRGRCCRCKTEREACRARSGGSLVGRFRSRFEVERGTHETLNSVAVWWGRGSHPLERDRGQRSRAAPDRDATRAAPTAGEAAGAARAAPRDSVMGGPAEERCGCGAAARTGYTSCFACLDAQARRLGYAGGWREIERRTAAVRAVVAKVHERERERRRRAS